MQCIHKKGKIRGRRKEERNVNTGQGKGKVESAVMVVASAVTESILEQTGKQGKCFWPASRTSRDWAKLNCCHWLHHHSFPSLRTHPSPGLLPRACFITTNCLPSFRHFGHGLTYFPTPYQDLLQRAFPNTTSFQCSVLSSCFPFPHYLPFLPMVWVVPGVRWHKQVSSGLRIAEPDRKWCWQLSLWGQILIKKCWQSGKAVP